MHWQTKKTDSVSVPKGFQLSTAAHYLLWSVLVLAISSEVLVPALVNNGPFGIWHVDNKDVICDFPSIFNFTKAFWLENRPPNISAYSVANHLHVTSSWAGREVSHSLSFGYSPTMLFILAPLVHFSHATAFCIFNGLGLLGVWWQTRPIRCRFGLGLLAFFSPLATSCFQQGQTALLTGAGLLFLFERSRIGFTKLISKQTLLAGIVLWALTAKPPLALTAIAVLLGLRQWQPVLLAGVLTLTTTFTISPILGPGWVSDYLHLISTHNKIQANPAFAFSHYPEHMTNLRGILSVDFKVQDNIASLSSSAIWLASLVWLSVTAPYLRFKTGCVWAIGVILYLLFCPHVSSFEVLQVVLLLPFCVSALNSRLSWQELVLLFVIPLLPFASPVSINNRLGLFTGLLSVIGLVTIYRRINADIDVYACQDIQNTTK